MVTREIPLGNKTYIACFSLSALASIEDYLRENNIDSAPMDYISTILADFKTRDVAWIASIMLEAGRAYAREEGIPVPEPISKEKIMSHCGVSELTDLIHILTEAITADATPTVEVVPAKNTEATPGT